MVSPLEAPHAAAPARRRRRPSRPHLTAPLSRRRRGSVSVLAMLYLVVFAALALGFYAQTNIASHVSDNELRAARAMAAAESGMEFIRYQLGQVKTAHLPENQMLVELANELTVLMEDSANLQNGLQEVGMSDAGDAILIPRDAAAMIPLGDGTGFRVKITRTGRRFLVKVVGRATTNVNSLGKGIEYTFEPRQVPAPIFDYGVVGRGQIELSGNGDIKGGTANKYGSVLTTTTTNPAIVAGSNALITGQVYLTNPTATTSYHATTSVGGAATAASQTANTVRPPAVTEPEFPTVDTSVYLPFVKRTVTSTGSGATYKNFRVPAGANLTFSGCVLEGVIYIEYPNNITFSGSTVVRGVIVTPNRATASAAPTSTLSFSGQATSHDISTLANVYDMSVAANRLEFPPELLALKGASILAPGFKVSMTGGYQSLSGTIVADQIAMAGNAGGYINGSLIALGGGKLNITGTGGVIMEKPATNIWPAGLMFRSYYAPASRTYREFPPRSEGM